MKYMIQNTFKTRRSAGLLFIIFFCAFIQAGNDTYAQVTLGARAISLGQATTALPGNTWSVFENPAMISDQQRIVSFFGSRYYGLSELTDVAAVVAYPTSIGVIGGGAHRYGNDLFNETRVRLSYKNSYQNFQYGAALNYTNISIGQGTSSIDYGSYGALGIDVGLAARMIDGLWIGAKATNVNQGQYGEVELQDGGTFAEEVPRNLSIGFSYQLSGVALFTTDVIKDVNFPISYRGGIEVDVIKNMKARAGITTAPQTFSCGFGYNTEQWGFNIVVQRHEEEALGFSPGIDFNISW